MIMPGSFYFRTFAKVALLPYIGGTVAHALRLIYKFPILETPIWLHWGIVVVGGYAGFGFIYHLRKIRFRGIPDKILYGLVIFHLDGSVIMHAYSLITRSNDWMGIFPMWLQMFFVSR